MIPIRTIADIENINLSDCYFFKNTFGQKVVTLSFFGRNFHHSFFQESNKGDYIIFKNKRYYYPYNKHRLVI